MPGNQSNYRLHTLAAVLMIGSVAFPAYAAEYKIDLSHSFIQFRTSHLGISVLVGRFNDFSGAFSWDKDQPRASSIELAIKTASVDSNWAERDKHLRGEEFLDVDKFAQATFKGTEYDGDARGGTMKGTLTLHGVSKPLTLQVTSVGEGNDPWGGYRAGFSASTSLRRADFGIDHNLGPAAETVEFDLFVEGIRQ